MKVSKKWLHELIDLNLSDKQLEDLLPLRTIGIKEVTDQYIELDMKGYNRADLLSLRGIALEVAAITDSKIKFDDSIPTLPADLPKLKVDIEPSNLCPFYSLTRIENLKVESSPKDWVEKLADCGIRSVNNIADVTNLVMLEFGQPMHAFDASKVANETITVRTAKNEEKIKTLDEKDRVLKINDLLITDEDKALGIAGVMGGKNSEVTDSTTTILLEAAIFDSKNLRKTATRLGLISEAGKRFYHGLTKQRLYQALQKAIELYKQLGGKVTAFTFEDQLNDTEKIITLNSSKVKSLIGVELGDDQIINYLKKLYFKLEEKEPGVWEVTIPFFRLDIDIEEDLIEEVARMYGYDKIPSKELVGELPGKIDQSIFDLIYKLKESLVKEGLTEVQTYSFYSADALNNIGWAPDHLEGLVKIANPISTETKYLKDQLWPNLLEVVTKNIKQYNFDDIAIFELGKVYSPKKEGVPEEGYALSLALMNREDDPIQELYSILQKAISHLRGVTLELANQDRSPIDKMLFHPTRFQHLSLNGVRIGKIAEVHPRIVNRFGITQRVAIVEISIEKLLTESSSN